VRNMKTDAILNELKKLRKLVEELSKSSMKLIDVSGMGKRDERAWKVAYDINQSAHDMLRTIDRNTSTIKHERSE